MLTPAQANTAIASHVSASADLLRHVADRGASYSRPVVLAYQRAYNARLSDLQQAIAVVQNGDVTLANRLRELTPDGVWGSQTGTATGLFISGGSVPFPNSLASQIPGWWNLHQSRVAQQVAYWQGQAQMGQTAAIAQQAQPPGTGTATTTVVPTTTPEIGTAAPAPVVARELEPVAITGRVGKPSGNILPWIVGGLAIVTVGGIIAYASLKRSRQKGKKS